MKEQLEFDFGTTVYRDPKQLEFDFGDMETYMDSLAVCLGPIIKTLIDIRVAVLKWVNTVAKHMKKVTTDLLASYDKL